MMVPAPPIHSSSLPKAFDAEERILEIAQP